MTIFRGWLRLLIRHWLVVFSSYVRPTASRKRSQVLTLDGTGDVRAWADLSPGATTISVRRVDESSGAALEEEWRVEKKSLVPVD